MLWGHDEYCAVVQHERKIEGRREEFLHESVDFLPLLLFLDHLSHLDSDALLFKPATVDFTFMMTTRVSFK